MDRQIGILWFGCVMRMVDHDSGPQLAIYWFLLGGYSRHGKLEIAKVLSLHNKPRKPILSGVRWIAPCLKI